jgi:hypothetical protein
VSSASLSLGSPIFAIASAPFETCLLEKGGRQQCACGMSVRVGDSARGTYRRCHVWTRWVRVRRGRGTVVVVACGGMRRGVVVILLMCGGWWWVRMRRGRGEGRVVACGGSDKVGEGDPTSSSHCCVVVIVIARWWSLLCETYYNVKGNTMSQGRCSQRDAASLEQSG